MLLFRCPSHGVSKSPCLFSACRLPTLFSEWRQDKNPTGDISERHAQPPPHTYALAHMHIKECNVHCIRKRPLLRELTGSGSGLALAHPSLFVSKCPQKPLVWGRERREQQNSPKVKTGCPRKQLEGSHFQTGVTSVYPVI